MADEDKTIIEINGVKMEVDLRTAKAVDNYRVGDTVKMLRKEYNSYAVDYAVIINFTDFKNLPTIELLSVDRRGDVQYRSYNAETKDIEIAPVNDLQIQFDYETITQNLNRIIGEKEKELEEARAKSRAFHEAFGKIFHEEKERANGE
jgi:hypothetical protein